MWKPLLFNWVAFIQEWARESSKKKLRLNCVQGKELNKCYKDNIYTSLRKFILVPIEPSELKIYDIADMIALSF